MNQRSISNQLLLFILVSAGVTLLAIAALGLLLQKTHRNAALLTASAVAQQSRSFGLADAVSSEHNVVQRLLRMKDPDEIEKALKEFESEQARATKLIAECGPSGQAIRTKYETLIAAEKAVVDHMLHGDSSAGFERFIETASPQYEQLFNEINSYVKASEESTKREIEKSLQSNQAKITAQSGGIVLLLLGNMIFGWRIRSSIVRRLNDLSISLTEASRSLNNSSRQVSAASQAVAEGASEQAAAIQETSASLEEMGSMTQRNSENAQSAKTLSNHTRSAAETGYSDMQQMSEAMDAIKQSSVNISKIIKTIDEIAFQTNILALNAAVEAARAGEAGMGFAVVADEVRNLAQRSAQAARETADKIQDSIEKSQRGLQFKEKVSKGLQEIVTKAREVDELVAQIAVASKEQSLGIEQIATAVSQMDKVTQSNAVNAEESAASADELGSQARDLKNVVELLRALVGKQLAKQKADIQVHSEEKTTVSASLKTTARNGDAPISNRRALSQGTNPE